MAVYVHTNVQYIDFNTYFKITSREGVYIIKRLHQRCFGCRIIRFNGFVEFNRLLVLISFNLVRVVIVTRIKGPREEVAMGPGP